MSRKSMAVILEILPLISAPLAVILIRSGYDSALIRRLITITFLLAFSGFAFFFIGRKLAGKDKAVMILGILDWLATLSIIAIYVIAIFSFGL